MIAFGPVPSRRLGRSLGINNIPPKICSYSCVYCQLGNTLTLQVDPSTFYSPEALVAEVADKLRCARENDESIDFLTFVPDGEPTLDANLEQEIGLLRSLGLRIAVISNASLIWRDDVRRALAKADWVSVKVDAVGEACWRRIDRPHKSLRLESILEGVLSFADAFEGRLVTETMLVRGLNDRPQDLEALGRFLQQVKPAVAYLSVPTRPPAEAWVRPPHESALNAAFHTLTGHVERVEYLIGYEGNRFAHTGDVQDDLLSITSVHPMRREAVETFLEKAGADWSTVDTLVRQGQWASAEYEGHTYYVRRFLGPGDHPLRDADANPHA